MSERALRHTAHILAAAVATTTLGLGTLVPAQADDSPAPVTGDDTSTVEARSAEFGGVSFIDVLSNDSAPTGEVLEICRVRAPERGLSVAEVQPDGSFTIETPNSGVGSGGNGPEGETSPERIVVLPWANRAGTYQFTYWACDSEHLTPATVTVTVEKTPEIMVSKTGRPGRVRFANPGPRRVVVLYGGIRQERPDGRVGLAPGNEETRRIECRAIRWVAFSPRSFQPLGEGLVRRIQLADTSGNRNSSPRGAGTELTPRMIRAWRTA